LESITGAPVDSVGALGQHLSVIDPSRVSFDQLILQSGHYLKPFGGQRMKRYLVPTLLLFVATAAFGQKETQTPNSHMKADPPALGIHWAKGAQPSNKARPSSNPNLLYHNGGVMNNVVVLPIYWGSTWSSSDPKIAGLNTFYSGMSGTQYARTSDEYPASATGQTNSAGTISVATQGHLFDNSGASGGQKTSAILAEVCRALTANGVAPVSNGYYPVYTDLPRGGAQYCAWHSWGACGSTNVQFAFFWKLDGDAGCDPKSTVTSNQGLAALANVSGHELSEARTDPRGAGWYDSGGAENADKCAWVFPDAYVSFGTTKWKVQGNWSNDAYNNGYGYANNSGQKGCLNGGSYDLSSSFK
jgi:hypothetical protein